MVGDTIVQRGLDNPLESRVFSHTTLNYSSKHILSALQPLIGRFGVVIIDIKGDMQVFYDIADVMFEVGIAEIGTIVIYETFIGSFRFYRVELLIIMCL